MKLSSTNNYKPGDILRKKMPTGLNKVLEKISRKERENGERDIKILDINYHEGWAEVRRSYASDEKMKITWLDWMIEENGYELLQIIK